MPDAQPAPTPVAAPTNKTVVSPAGTPAKPVASPAGDASAKPGGDASAKPTQKEDTSLFDPELPPTWDKSDKVDDVKVTWLSKKAYPGNTDPDGKHNLYAIYQRGATMTLVIVAVHEAIFLVLKKVATMKDKASNLYKLGNALLSAMNKGLLTFNDAIVKSCHDLLHYGKFHDTPAPIEAVQIPKTDSLADLAKDGAEAGITWWSVVESVFKIIAGAVPALQNKLMGGVSYYDLLQVFMDAGHKFFDEWTNAGHKETITVPPKTRHAIDHLQRGELNGTEGQGKEEGESAEGEQGESAEGVKKGGLAKHVVHAHKIEPVHVDF